MHPHQLLTVRLGDGPDAWESAGFTVDRGAGEPQVVLGTTVVVLSGSGGGFEGWALDGVSGEIDGLQAVPPGGPGATLPTAAAHPNGAVRLDHVVVVTGDRDRTLHAFGRAGLGARGDRQGTAFGGPVRQTFLWAGDVIVEVVAPDGPADDRPAAVFGLAVAVEDLEATAALLGDRLGHPRDAVQPGRTVATLRHRELGMGLPVLMMSPHVRAAGPSGR